MSTISPQALTSDIQLALEQAVDQANSAYARATDELHSKKKTKRKRNKHSDAGTVDGADSGHRAGKKSKVHEDEATATKESEMNGPTPGQEPIHDDVQASTAAFISAIVAAASDAPVDPGASYLQQELPFPDQNPPYGFLPGMAPPPMGVPFSDLSSASNDEVLRAIQALDVSKIADVLKTLNEAAATANIPLNFPAGTFDAPPSAARPLPGAEARQPSKKSTKNPKHMRALASRAAERHHPSDHAELLATKWMNTTKLNELAKSEGLVYKKGKFSAIEEQQLKDAIDKYCEEKQVSSEEFQDLVFGKKSKESTFWSDITIAVPQRPLIAIYHYVRRHYHPLAQQGKWTAQEDALLKQAVVDLGPQWEKVSLRVGRMSADCRDRHRNHIVNREIRNTGTWTREEEEKLTEIVTKMTVDQGKDFDNDIFWGKVSEMMGGIRGRQQCRIKWTDTLSNAVKNAGQKARWTQLDAFILVHKVDSLNVMDDTEIDWRTLSDPDWNLWSGHMLQRRWCSMKRGIKGHEDMTHREIMDILRVKKAQLPLPLGASKKRKDRKVTSSEAIEDVRDDEDDEEEVEVEQMAL
ncbi:hypothetical protein ONZ45_g14326 [Pleurotus djamor]|nr:hypothetical protein ONZ45_g14326 [Pleurotus djamor]